MEEIVLSSGLELKKLSKVLIRNDLNAYEYYTIK